MMIENKNISKKLVISILVVVVVAIGSFAAFKVFNDASSRPEDKWVDGVNYRQPTKEEKQAGDQRKEEIDQEEKERNERLKNDNQELKVTASVIITDASQYDDIIEVRSFIPDHYENGTCTIIFQKGSMSLKKTAPAYKDVSTTICTNPEIKRSEFKESGSWEVIVKYSSSGAIGTSESQIINIR